MNHNYNNLRSLYRAAAREEQPTRADKRAVRAALVAASAAAAGVTLHTSTAAGKLIALIPGGAKVFTIGQVVAYAGLGVALGGGIAAVSVAVSPKTPAAKSATMPSASTRKSPGTALQSAGYAASAAATQQPMVVPIANPRSTATGALAVDKPSQAPSSSGLTERTMPLPGAAASIAPTVVPAMASAAAPLAPASPPSLAEESRGLAAIQTALGAHDANRALALLDAQDREYGAGHLGQERAAARVLALCAAGRRSEALVARDRFMANYPGSPLIHRVDAACKK